MKILKKTHYVTSIRVAIVSRKTTLLKAEEKLRLPLCVGEISDGETEVEDIKFVVSL